MAAITLRDVRKSYGKSPVIHGISLDIADREFIVIVGPSGCGKSTLLRMVAGLEEITSGTIEIAGRVVNRLEPRERDIAMVFQNYALYPHMSVFDNMAYGLKIAGKSKPEIAERVGLSSSPCWRKARKPGPSTSRAMPMLVGASRPSGIAVTSARPLRTASRRAIAV